MEPQVIAVVQWLDQIVVCIHSRLSDLKGKTFSKSAPDWTQFNPGVEGLIAIKEYQKNSFSAYKIQFANIRWKWDCHKQNINQDLAKK